MLCVYKQYFSLIAIFIADSEMKIDEFFFLLLRIMHRTMCRVVRVQQILTVIKASCRRLFVFLFSPQTLEENKKKAQNKIVTTTTR